MKKPETADNIRKREKRLNIREYYNCISAGRKKRRSENAAYQEQMLAAGSKALKRNKQKDNSDEKRPGYEKFLSAFSFITSTPYDKRCMIPPGCRCRSFNEQRQYIDFLREFIYPYKIPKVLIWTAFEKETVVINNGRNRPSPDIKIITAAKKWINDIVSGGSFYRMNKEYFTRAEAHFFLNSEILYNDPGSVIELVFYARCMARKMGVKLSRNVSKTFTRKFAKHWNHSIVTGFLDLIARSSDYSVENNGLDDICDFVLSKIIKERKVRNRPQPFSFSGRTMSSVIALANEWHANIIREQELQNALTQAGRMANRQTGQVKRSEINRWKGINIFCTEIEDDVFIWSFTQLCDVQALLNEGRLMKNCVSSYSVKCSAGESALFHVSRVSRDDKFCENIATLEVSKNRILIQAKAKCNTKISSVHIGAIRKWTQLNRIKMDLSY